MKGILVLLFATSAHAFGLSDHEAITRQAVQEFNRCFPGSVSAMTEAVIQDANRSEDTNVFVKWSKYSHFFHPYKNIKQRRAGSDERVADLEADLHSGQGDEGDFGHIIHHLQDMASPPHVVPVNHWLTDGFESFGIATPSGGSEDCKSVIFVEGYRELHLATAAETLKRVREEKLEARKNGAVVPISWTGFWQESSNNEFGEYGFLGNSFGDAKVSSGRDRYEFGSLVFRTMKERQLRLAVDATKRALYVLLKP